MRRPQIRRCRAGFDLADGKWYICAPLNARPIHFTQCVRQREHPANGHIIDGDGLYSDLGKLKSKRSARMFEILVGDWLEGRAVWVSKGYKDAIKREIREGWGVE